jgi:hypothetical protein
VAITELTNAPCPWTDVMGAGVVLERCEWMDAAFSATARR